MKKNNLFITIATFLMLPDTMHAGTCTLFTPADGAVDECESILDEIECSSRTGTKYYKSPTGDSCYAVYSCNACDIPFTKVTRNAFDCTNVTYTACECVCTSECINQPWTTIRSGYEERTYGNYCSCSGNTARCTGGQLEHRCAEGYYGLANNGPTSCTLCPSWAGVYTDSARTTLAQGTSSAGTTTISGCYIAPGTYYDASGKFGLTKMCLAS